MEIIFAKKMNFSCHIFIHLVRDKLFSIEKNINWIIQVSKNMNWIIIVEININQMKKLWAQNMNLSLF